VVGLLENIQERKLVQSEGCGSHIIIADAQGNAAIIEAGKDENEISPMTGDFIVMTNFPVSRYDPYEHASRTGDERYVKAKEYIQGHLDEFDVDHAFSVLARTAQDHTISSMVFVPAENSVYLALDGVFLKRWRISLSEGTMETYQGLIKTSSYAFPTQEYLLRTYGQGIFLTMKCSVLESS